MTVPDTLPPELAELGELLREEPPRPSEGWARRLDERAAAGFPAPPRAVRNRKRRRRSWLRVAMAPAAVVLLVAVIAVPVALDGGGADERGSSGGGSAEVSSGGGGGGATAAPQSSEAKPASGRDSATALSAPAPIPPSGGGSPRSDARSRRSVERSAALTLSAAPDDVDDVADGVVRVTDAVGGFVASSNVYGGSRDAHASFALRIPTARLQKALADLSRLAHVRERSQAAQDITAQAVSARARLQEARRERQSLLRQLGRAVTINETESIKARLRLVNRRIEAARASVRRVSNRANFANVSVELVADEGAAAAPGDKWTPGDAFDDAVRVLEVAAGILVIALALLLPLGLVGGLGWLGGRIAVRRRRERALDVA
jgi:hypothetical protein